MQLSGALEPLLQQHPCGCTPSALEQPLGCLQDAVKGKWLQDPRQPHPTPYPWGGAKQRGLSPPPSHPFPSLPMAGGDASWADSEVDSSCTGQPIHLWQFLKELLLKPHNYGRFIRWLNKEKGGWDSAQVARLWGIRKNRPAMNYDKLSRSIRQYYKKGIIRKPDISQRLVYQFPQKPSSSNKDGGRGAGRLIHPRSCWQRTTGPPRHPLGGEG
uniref:SAM pointed domain containing ETS transcription factor n=1 Tax=Otus sunia TaxID=257818 RepID=A0A8C8AAV4_9STRI